MLQMPRRSVTRFFIPLIDVLTLLFCIFLLLPLVRPGEGAPVSAELAEKEERIRRMELELENQRREGSELPQKLQAELERLRRERTQLLQNRLALRVLEIDASTGKLYYQERTRKEIRTQADAEDLIERDRLNRKKEDKELYFLILYPRDPQSPYPLREQRETYERWFAETAHGFDVPGLGMDKRDQP